MSRPAPETSPPRPSPADRPADGCGQQAFGLVGALRGALAANRPAILVTVTDARGSTPREVGAAMLVTADASCGTVGGGHLEYHAIDVARVMLARGETGRDLEMPLGPLLGQCCGGHVRLSLRLAGGRELERLAEAEGRERAARPPVLVFGCGHTGLALAQALAPLPLATTVVDDRLDPVAGLPAGVPLIRLDDPVGAVADASPGSAFVVMTHSHALDYRVTEAALRRGDACYVGMIGSATKRARFARAFRQGGGAAAALAGLACPVGGGQVPDKRPAVIAALAAAEILRACARYGSCTAVAAPMQEVSP